MICPWLLFIVITKYKRKLTFLKLYWTHSWMILYISILWMYTLVPIWFTVRNSSTTNPFLLQRPTKISKFLMSIKRTFFFKTNWWLRILEHLIPFINLVVDQYGWIPVSSWIVSGGMLKTLLIFFSSTLFIIGWN